MELIPFLANNPLLVALGLAGFFLIGVAARLGRSPAPIRIPLPKDPRRRSH